MKIVAGYIDTEESRSALDRAIEEAVLRDAHLVIVRRFSGHEKPEEVLHARDGLEDISDELTEQGVSFEVREVARGGDVASDLVGFADEIGAGLIVIGLRRRTPVGKLILGSDAQQVLLHATCPVLAVHADGEQ